MNGRRPYGTGSVSQHGRNWRGRARIDGEQVRFNLGVRKDINPAHGISKKQAEAKLRGLVESYKPVLPQQRITFSELAAKFVTHKEAMNRERSTLEAYRSTIKVHLGPEFGSRHAASITAGDVERLQARMMRTAKPKSVRNWISVLHAILEFGVKKGVLTKNVAKAVDRPKVSRRTELPLIFRMADIAKIRAAVPHDAYGDSLSTMILVSARSGIRQSECIAIRRRDFDFKTDWIRVTRAYVRGQFKNPKGGKGRGLPMMAEVKEALEAHFDRFPHIGEDDLVFAHPETRRPLDRSKLLKVFKKAVVDAGVGPTARKTYRTSRGASQEVDQTETNWHAIRHAFTTFCAAQGIPPRLFMEWVGHEDYETMMIYNHYSPGGFELDILNAAAQRDAAECVGPSLGSKEDRAASATTNLEHPDVA